MSDLPIGRHEANGTSLSVFLAHVAATLSSERVTLEDLLALLRDRSMAVILLVLALPMAVPIPAPGISVVFGVPMTLIAVQLAFGRTEIWLPAFIARRSLNGRRLASVLTQSTPYLCRLERLVYPRWPWLAGSWSKAPVGLVCAILALIITLPIPLGHFVPGTAISLLALGLLERDGLVIGIGVLVAIFGIALVLAASVGAAHLFNGFASTF